MSINDLSCKSCGAPLNPDGVVERQSMARCGHCGAVFSLTRGGDSEHASQLHARRPEVPMPKGIRLQELGSTLEITRRWFSPMFLFLAFFCVFWNGFMIVWHVVALSMGAWFMSMFGLFHTAVGIGLLYFTIAGFVNQTVINVGRSPLEIRHAPLPWPGNKTLSIHDLEQLYCQEKTHRGKNGTSFTYEVNAICDGNVRKKLVKGLQDPDQALYIEQELERFLNIEDSGVRGELTR